MEQARYFIHIPKTGGTSVIGVLDRFYPISRICPWQLWAEVPDAPTFDDFGLIRGHFGAGGLAPWLPEETLKMTMLREPRSHLVSTFAHIRRETQTRHHDDAVKLGLPGFLDNPQSEKGLRDRQTGFLSFHPKHDPALDQALFAPHSAARVEQLIDRRVAPLSEDARLQRAVAQLERCEWFGLLERFDESMWLLARQLRVPPVGETSRARSESEDRDQLRSDAALCRAQIDEATRVDRALYAVAMSQFEVRMRDARRHHSLPSSFRAESAVLAQGQAMRYGFDQMLMGCGWHVRELQLPEKDYFRWTGPQRKALIELPVQASTVHAIRVRFVNAVDDAAYADMIWTINGQRVKPEDMDGDGPVRQFYAPVPVEAATSGPVSLGIELPHTFRLCDSRSESDDVRRVGVAVHWIELINEERAAEAQT